LGLNATWYGETTLKRYVLPCAFRLRYRSAFNAVHRRKVTVVASQRQIQRRFARVPVGGSRNEGVALKRSAFCLDKQDDFKVDWLYKIEATFIAVQLTHA
jgi:hypothetical protein